MGKPPEKRSASSPRETNYGLKMKRKLREKTQGAHSQEESQTVRGLLMPDKQKSQAKGDADSSHKGDTSERDARKDGSNDGEAIKDHVARMREDLAAHLGKKGSDEGDAIKDYGARMRAKLAVRSEKKIMSA